MWKFIKKALVPTLLGVALTGILFGSLALGGVPIPAFMAGAFFAAHAMPIVASCASFLGAAIGIKSLSFLGKSIVKKRMQKSALKAQAMAEQLGPEELHQMQQLQQTHPLSPLRDPLPVILPQHPHLAGSLQPPKAELAAITR